jgi:sugar lactone lactonase YvrE
MGNMRWVSILFAAPISVVLILLGACGSTSIPGNPSGGGGTHESSYLAVSDLGNERVLIYDSPFTTGESASIILGQPDFAQNGTNQSTSPTESGAAANTLSGPTGLAMDPAGNLYVADTNNCRVLQFRPPFDTNMTASLVFGQPTLNEPFGGCMVSDSSQGQPSPASASGMNSPGSLTVDGQGNLWVADFNAGRVTEYVPPFSSGMPTVVALGQTSVDNTYECNGAPDVNAPSSPPTSATLCSPSGVAVDSQGDVWVADTSNDRVLEFVPPFSTGMPARLELGQPAGGAFTSAGCASSVNPSSLCQPMSVAFDSSGNLWVADTFNNRVMEFVAPFSNDKAASLVIGQPSFTTAEIRPPSGNTLNHPAALSFDRSGDLIVADEGNSRTLLFVRPFTDGMSATAVIGQMNMMAQNGIIGVSSCAPPSANTLCSPAGVLTF